MGPDEALNETVHVVFVAGVSRSGSTLLDFILGNRPGGFALGEIYAWYRPFRAHHIDPRCTCGKAWHACEIWQRVGRPTARHLYRRAAEALDLTIVVDSSKNLTWIRDAHRWAEADGLHPHVVLSWRPPKEIAYSYWRRGDRSPSKPTWMSNLEGYVRRLDDLRVGYHVVAFDHLINDPATTIGALHAAMGLESWPGQERFWEGEYHSMFGSGGTKDQLQRGSTKLEQPELPAAFLEYWDALPGAWRERMEELNTTILSRSRVPSSTRRLPPLWYAKSRAVAYRQERIVRRRSCAAAP